MKTHRARLAVAAVSLLVVIAGSAVWWVDTPAHAAEPWRTALVRISGTVSGSPESVDFSGQAKINSRVAPDPDFKKPRLLLSIDLSGVSGVGAKTRKKYVISGPEMVQRRLAASHLVEITFPFVEESTQAISRARTGVASFALTFDVNTGSITTATASVATPNFAL